MKWILCALFSLTSLLANDAIELNNRPLAKVNGKTLSLIDVVKQMNVFIKQFSPEVRENPANRFQFYQGNWRYTLDRLIDNNLILLDAEAKEVKVEEGEVREELYNRFGPNIILSLAEVGMSMEEAHDMVEMEMIVDRMRWSRVQAKAMQDVTPNSIKVAYDRYCVEYPPETEWEYDVLTIRDPNTSFGEELAKKAYALLAEKKDLNIVNTALESKGSSVKHYSAKDKDVSKAHLKVLGDLEIGKWSEPIAQVSRADNRTVYRVFHLIQKDRKETPALLTVYDNIKNNLLEQKAEKYYNEYVSKLRDQFRITENFANIEIPKDYQPFSFKP